VSFSLVDTAPGMSCKFRETQLKHIEEELRGDLSAFKGEKFKEKSRLAWRSEDAQRIGCDVRVIGLVRLLNVSVRFSADPATVFDRCLGATILARNLQILK